MNMISPLQDSDRNGREYIAINWFLDDVVICAVIVIDRSLVLIPFIFGGRLPLHSHDFILVC